MLLVQETQITEFQGKNLELLEKSFQRKLKKIQRDQLPLFPGKECLIIYLLIHLNIILIKKLTLLFG